MLGPAKDAAAEEMRQVMTEHLGEKETRNGVRHGETTTGTECGFWSQFWGWGGFDVFVWVLACYSFS